MPLSGLRARRRRARLLGAHAGILFPERSVAAQLRIAAAHGAHLRCVVRMLDITERAGQTPATVVTDAGEIVATHVIVTTGAWLPEMLAPPQRARFAVQRQVLHWFATDEPELYAPERCPVFIWMHGLTDEAFYGFPKADAYVGVKDATEQAENATTCAGVDRSVTATETAIMYEGHVRGRLRAVLPRSVHDATYLYTSTADARFVIDRHPEFEHVTLVSACLEHGFKHSAAVDEAVAAGVLGARLRHRLGTVQDACEEPLTGSLESSSAPAMSCWMRCADGASPGAGVGKVMG